MSIIKTKAILTCPICNAKQDVEMPINACQHFYKCTNCNKMLKPKKETVVYFAHMLIVSVLPKQQEAQM